MRCVVTWDFLLGNKYVSIKYIDITFTLKTPTQLQRVVLTFLAMASLSFLLACGEEAAPFCGDGMLDLGEKCDDGNRNNRDECRNDCTPKPHKSTVVAWTFNKSDIFSGDNCLDVGASKILIELEGAKSYAKTDSCTWWQTDFMDVESGIYAAKITPQDSSGVSLVREAASLNITVSEMNQTVSVDVGPDKWKQPPNGTLFFRINWDGKDCTEAGVTHYRINVGQGGNSYSGVTKDGAPVDGSDVGVCQSISEPQSQSAIDLPFGLATIEIHGLSGGEEVFHGMFETFIGSGLTNPEQLYSVPAIEMP